MGGHGFTCNTKIYGLPLDLRAAHKFMDTWSPHMRHTIVSTPGNVGTSQKGKSHDMIQNIWASYFFYNLSQYLQISGYNDNCCSKH